MKKIHSNAQSANVAAQGFVVTVEDLRCQLCKSNLKATICVALVASAILIVAVTVIAVIIYVTLHFLGIV